MVLIVAIVSILVVGIGMLGFASPAGVIALVSRFQSKVGLRAASIFRVGFGVALWFAASASRPPIVLKVLAVVSVVSGLVLRSIGVPRFQSILSWWCRQSPLFIRVWSAAALGVGAFILWSVVV